MKKSGRLTMKIKLGLLGILCCLGLFPCGCQHSGTPNQKELSMSTPELPDAAPGAKDMFFRPYYDAQEHPDSPQAPNPQWRGVLISAPERSVLTLRQPMVILRGTFAIQGNQMTESSRLVLKAVDLRTKQEYSGVAGQQDPSPVVPDPNADEPEDPEDIELARQMIYTGFFNTDIIGMLGLPRSPGAYRVWAEYGTVKSNEINLQILDK